MTVLFVLSLLLVIACTIIAIQQWDHKRAQSAYQRNMRSSREELIELHDQLSALSEAVERLKRERDEAEHAAMHDYLTGIPNRRALHVRAEVAIAAAKRNKAAVACLYLDLVGLKRVNDEHGQPAGDELIRQFARMLTQSVREQDTVARVSGDEFIVILADIRVHGEQLERIKSVRHLVKLLLARLRLYFAEPVEVAADIRVPLEFRVGIALHPYDASGLPELEERAAVALKRLKGQAEQTQNFFRDLPGEP